MRDLVRNLGGLLMECYICCRKPPKLQAISLRRYRSSVLLVRFAQPAKLRLRKTQAFFFAQNDRLVDCFAVIVRFRRGPGTSSPTRKFYLPRRGELCSPVLTDGMRSFSGAPRDSPTGCLFTHGSSFVFRDVENVPLSKFKCIRKASRGYGSLMFVVYSSGA